MGTRITTAPETSAFLGAEQQAHQPAHAGEAIIPRTAVSRVAGLVQRRARRLGRSPATAARCARSHPLTRARSPLAPPGPECPVHTRPRPPPAALVPAARGRRPPRRY